MPTKIEATHRFLKDMRNLAKKYPSVVDEVEKLSEGLKQDERPGDQIPNLDFEVYKVRLPNRSAKRGKSGGFRVIYYLKLVDYIVLLRIYSKTQQEDITLDAIQQALEDVVSDEDDSSS